MNIESSNQIMEESKKADESSSETSSFHDSDQEKVLGDKIKLAGKGDLELESASDSEDEDILESLDDEEGPVPNLPVSYVKTVHEVNPEEVEKVGLV